MKSVYRKSALDKLSSLEQLDKAMKVSTPMSWIALFGITVIIVVTLIWSIKGRLPSTVTAKGVLVSTNTSTNTVFSEEAGTVQAIEGYGHDVYLDTPILELAVDGKNKVYYSDQVGIVSEVLVNAGDTIKYGTEILRIRPKVSAAQEQVAVCYVARGDVDKVDRGMDVHITLTSADSSTYGYMMGRVINIDEWATTTTGIERAVGENNSMASSFTSNGSVCAVTCEIVPDASTKSGYYWSNEKGRQLEISGQTMCTVKIITEEVPPISKLFTKLKDIWENK